MSFDALLTLVFILLFVVGPLVQRMSKGGRQQQGGDRPAPPRAPEAPRRQWTEQQSPEGEADARPDSPLAERLEEARRRVQDAMGEDRRGRARTREESRTGTYGPGDYGDGGKLADGRDRPALDWQQTASQARSGAAGSQQPDLDWQKVVMPEESFMGGRQRERPERVEPADDVPTVTRGRVRSERLDRDGETARLSLGRRIALEPRGVLHGLMWHEILSEPVSKRGTRRQTSRLRSR